MTAQDHIPTPPKIACQFHMRGQRKDTDIITQDRPYSTPIFLLAPGRCFSSLACAMLGQHPQLYGLPETQLLVRDGMGRWWDDFGEGVHSHGLLRSVAEIVFGRQSAQSIRRAQLWLWSRRNTPTHAVLAQLAAFVYPLTIVEKTPMVTYRPEHMKRVFQCFPDARFIHLVRHPFGYGQSLIEFFLNRAPRRDPARLIQLLRNDESIFFRMFDGGSELSCVDPGEAWFTRQNAVRKFLASIPERQHIRVRGEELLSRPDTLLAELCEWLGIRSDPAAIDSMKHPERWPYACFGPANARHGGDPKFLMNPGLRVSSARQPSVDEPVPWADDGSELKPHVKELARFFGYR